ncbi:MAG: cytidylate kinase-like family protein [Magnetococcus sp. DMHC-1]|nr:cytidylate kinase-like family protein [Magnetococcales bacterium]
MAKDTMDVIHSILSANQYQPPQKTDVGVLAKPLVTISRMYGANGSAIANLLAETLGVQLYDRELLKAVVKEAKGNAHIMEQLDERATTAMDDIIQGFFVDKGSANSNFFRYMVKVILGISSSGGVIVGRGAHLVIPTNRPTLRVRIEGSLDMCTKRVAKRLEIKERKAEKIIIEKNRDRDKFVEKIASKYPNPRAYYDLTINTDFFEPERVVRIILVALREIGFPVPTLV